MPSDSSRFNSRCREGRDTFISITHLETESGILTEYSENLTEIIRDNDIRSVTIVRIFEFLLKYMLVSSLRDVYLEMLKEKYSET